MRPDLKPAQIAALLEAAHDLAERSRIFAMPVVQRIHLRIPDDVRRKILHADRPRREENLANLWRMHVASLRSPECDCGQTDGGHDFLCPMFGVELPECNCGRTNGGHDFRCPMFGVPTREEGGA